MTPIKSGAPRRTLREDAVSLTHALEWLNRTSQVMFADERHGEDAADALSEWALAMLNADEVLEIAGHPTGAPA